MMRILLLVIPGGFLTVMAPAQPLSAVLVLNDNTVGTFPAGAGTQLIPYHSCTLRLFGLPGERTAFFLSTTWPTVAASYAGIPVGVDLNNLVVLWNGGVDPSAPVIGPAGWLDFTFTVPEPAPIGDFVHVQAARFLIGGQVLPSLPLDLRWSGEPLVNVDTGVNSTHPLALSTGGGLLTVIDPPSWATFWTQHAGPGVPPPVVDFNHDFVIARFLGNFPTMGIGVQVTDAYVDGAAILHVYTVQSFGGPPPPPIPTQPYSIVRAPRSILSNQLQEHFSTVFYP